MPNWQRISLSLKEKVKYGEGIMETRDNDLSPSCRYG
jgi:hypothetical protein